MNRKVIKVISVLMMLFMIVSMYAIPTFAVPTYEDQSNVSFSSKDDNTTNVVSGMMGTIINVIQVVGMAIAVIMLVYVAIKYMSAAPAEKAEFKKSATAYIVGAVLLFGATGILQLVQNFALNNLK